MKINQMMSILNYVHPSLLLMRRGSAGWQIGHLEGGRHAWLKKETLKGTVVTLFLYTMLGIVLGLWVKPGGEGERERGISSLAYPDSVFVFVWWRRKRVWYNIFRRHQTKTKKAVWLRETSGLVGKFRRLGSVRDRDMIELCRFDFKLKWVQVCSKFNWRQMRYWRCVLSPVKLTVLSNIDLASGCQSASSFCIELGSPPQCKRKKRSGYTKL